MSTALTSFPPVLCAAFPLASFPTYFPTPRECLLRSFGYSGVCGLMSLICDLSNFPPTIDS